MRRLSAMRSLQWLSVPILHSVLLCGSARADIFAYTAEDGTISLSNVPTDDRFALLIESPRAAAAPPARVAPSAKALPAAKDSPPYAPIVDKVARDYGLESALLHAVITVESHYDANAVSRAGAAGLMQLMPATAKRYGVDDRFDPEQNMHGGARYLRDLLERFNSDTSLALAAYNAGENAVYKYGNRIPPYRETTDYVKRVLAKYRKYQTEM